MSSFPTAAGPAVARDLWWLNPGWIVLAALLPVYLSFLAFDYSRVVPVAYIPSALYLWGLVLLLALALGAGLGAWGGPPGPVETIIIPRWVPLLLLTGTLTAYAVWFHPLAARPQLILEVLRSERDNLRDVMPTLPPLTTLTQWGAAYGIVYAIRRSGRRRAGWERAGMWVIVALAALRSVVWNERLALIEVVFCFVVARLAFVRLATPLRSRVAALAPLAAPLLLYLGFTATEYFRSWEFYRRYYDSIWRFALDRLTAYYAVASNNGIGLLTESHEWPTYDGSFVFQWAHPQPPPGASNFLLSAAQLDYHQFLANFARPELNNPSGLFVVVYDIGFLGSVLYFLVVGALIGLAYRAFRAQRLGGVLFYPVCVLFLSELLRFNYFAASRFVPTAIALVLTYVATRRLRLGAGVAVVGERP